MIPKSCERVDWGELTVSEFLPKAWAVGIAVLLADDNLLDQSDFMLIITNVLSQWAHSNHQGRQKTHRFMRKEYRLHFQRLSWCWGIHLVQVAPCVTAVWAADWALGSGSPRQEALEWCWSFAFLGEYSELGLNFSSLIPLYTSFWLMC